MLAGGRTVSCPLMKVLRMVGETADSVSRRKLEFLPAKFLDCEVLRVSFGRAEERSDGACKIGGEMEERAAEDRTVEEGQERTGEVRAKVAAMVERVERS